MNVDSGDLRAVARLWGELGEFPAFAAAEARRHCFSSLSRIIGGANVFWVAAARDADASGDILQGWRPRAVARLHQHSEYDQRVADVVRAMNGAVVDPMTLANNRHVGRTRAFLRAELVEDRVWEGCALVNETMKPAGVTDRLISTLPLGGDREAHLGVDRRKGDRPFGARERDLLNLFLLGSRPFHQEQFLAQAAPRPALTPREQKITTLLLTEMSEREIGETLGLTPRTVHQYAVSIFKKYAVRGRLGLMALWLRRGAPAP